MVRGLMAPRPSPSAVAAGDSATAWPASRGRVRYPAVAGALGLTSLGCVASTLGLGRWAAPTGLGLALAFALAALALRRGRTLAVHGVSGSGPALVFEGAGYVLPRAAVRGGWVVPEARGARVELSRRGGAQVSADVSSVDDGAALLESAGIDAASQTQRITLGGEHDALRRALAALLFGGLQTLTVLALFAASSGLHGAPRAALFTAVTLGGFVMALRALGPTEMSLGARGVSLRRGLRRGVIPWEALRGAEAEGADVVLLREDGARERLGATDGDAARAARAAACVRAALGAARRGR
jgi:hypothetical protein